jgi:hypothetical protein
MKYLLILISFIGVACCTTKTKYETHEVKIPVVQKYKTTRQFSVFPPEVIWVAKLANGDSIKSYSVPQDTVTFIYYKRIK